MDLNYIRLFPDDDTFRFKLYYTNIADLHNALCEQGNTITIEEVQLLINAHNITERAYQTQKRGNNLKYTLL